MASQRLTKQERITQKKDFIRLIKRGKRLRLEQIAIAYITNDLTYSRLGISVGRKIGKAVKRNRIKRVLRELFRLNKEALPKGYDMLFMPNAGFRADSLMTDKEALLDKLNKISDK